MFSPLYREKAILRSMLGDLKNSGYTPQKRDLIGGKNEKRYLIVELIPLKPFKREPRGFIAVFFDNTPRVKMLQELEENNEALALANARLASYTRDLERLAAVEERNRLAGKSMISWVIPSFCF